MKWNIGQLSDEQLSEFFNLTREQVNDLLAQADQDKELVINQLSHQHIQSGARHVALTESEAKLTSYEDVVCEWGLSVCKHCGAAEGEWDNNETCIGHLDSLFMEPDDEETR